MQVGKKVFGSTADQVNTMVNALADFEGAPCVDPKIKNVL